jgi:hypothetical protein
MFNKKNVIIIIIIMVNKISGKHIYLWQIEIFYPKSEISARVSERLASTGGLKDQFRSSLE